MESLWLYFKMGKGNVGGGGENRPVVGNWSTDLPSTTSVSRLSMLSGRTRQKTLMLPFSSYNIDRGFQDSNTAILNSCDPGEETCRVSKSRCILSDTKSQMQYTCIPALTLRNRKTPPPPSPLFFTLRAPWGTSHLTTPEWHEFLHWRAVCKVGVCGREQITRMVLCSFLRRISPSRIFSSATYRTAS